MKGKLIAFFVLAFLMLATGSAKAAAPPSVTYKGITLSPAIVNLELAPNQAKSTFKITITNNQSLPISLTTSSLDFKSLNETGGVAFIGANSNQLQHKYGLANWLSVPAQSINLGPNKTQIVSITIDNRDDLSPGGHYAAVLFKNAGSSGQAANKVNFNQVVATLVFLKKTGGEIYSLQLSQPSLKTQYFSLPGSIGLHFKNIGNTQTVPRGTLSVYGPNGKMYERGVINPDSGLVLPDSTRFFRTSITKTGHSWLPGKYKAVITYRPEDISTARTDEYSFYYVNLLSLAVAVAAAASLAYLAKTFLLSGKLKKLLIRKS
jgi:hypothetical protein